MRLIDTDKLKFPNIAIFDMKLHGATVPMVRLIDLQMLMPTVDAAPVKHGRWRKTNNPNYSPFDGSSEHLSICSNCAYSREQHDFLYCPNCGAKMDLEEEEAL